MQITIQEKKENSLLERTQILGIVQFDKATPSNNEVAELIAKQLKVDGALITMNHLYTAFGLKEAKFDAFVYANALAKTKFTVVTAQMKKKTEEEKKKAEEAKKAAAPAQ